MYLFLFNALSPAALVHTTLLYCSLIYEEVDESFFLGITKSADANYLFINAAAQVTSETRYIELADEESEIIPIPVVLFPRQNNVVYSVESHGPHFYFLTNENSINNWLFRVAKIEFKNLPTGQLSGDIKTELSPLNRNYVRETIIEHREYVLIEDFQVRKSHVMVFERSNCTQNVRVIDICEENAWDKGRHFHYIDVMGIGNAVERGAESLDLGTLCFSLWPGSVDDEIAELSKDTLWATDVFRCEISDWLHPNIFY